MKQADYNAKRDLTPEGEAMVELPSEHKDILSFIEKSIQLRPDYLIMSDIKWQHLVRSVLRGKNILMTGPSGCGKTIAAFATATALNRPRFDFNLGNTGDPRSTLIGNTHFDKESGTFFAESHFVKAIQTENAVIVLDELTRAHPDAWNILMSVIDYKQRYLRLDDKDTSDKITVAKGVSFIATANIGIEYTATRQIDRALSDRFTILEIPVLTSDQEYELLKQIYPELNDAQCKAVADYADGTREYIKADDSKISTIISTRMSIEFAGLLYDGFSLEDAAEAAIMPFYPDGDERQFMKQNLQKYIIIPETKGQKKSNKPATELFTAADKAELTGDS